MKRLSKSYGCATGRWIYARLRTERNTCRCYSKVDGCVKRVACDERTKEYDTYSLRHTHGTMLIENGADMVYVQRRLGHKNINVTMNIYTNHLTQIIKSRNNITLNNMY